MHIAKEVENLSYNHFMNGKKILLIILSCFMLFASAQNLAEIKGLVEIRESVNSPWRPAVIDQDFGLGAYLRTFDASVELHFGQSVIKLDKNSLLKRLAYYPYSYELIAGNAYVKADDVIFFVDGPLEVNGEVIFSSKEDLKKAAVITGELRVLRRAKAVIVSAGEQISSSAGEIMVAKAYPEFPWYKGLAVVENGIAKVVGFSGKAKIKRDDWQDVSIEDELKIGQSLKTFENSWLEVSFDKSLIRLQANTEIELKEWSSFEDNSSRTVLELKQGKVWAIINNDGQPFEIDTPGLIAGVRGTKFRLDSSDESKPPLIKTFEGNVAGINDVGFVEIEAGKQYDPKTGLQELVLDDLDRANLARDELLGKPKLIVKDLNYYTNDSKVLIVGISDADKIIVNNKEISPKDYRFSIEVDLQYGLNYIEIIAKNNDSSSKAIVKQVIVRVGEN